METALHLRAAGLAALALGRKADRRADARTGAALTALPHPRSTFDPAGVAALPGPARRYFLYTIAPGTPLRTTAVIEMAGEIGMGRAGSPPPAARCTRARSSRDPRASSGNATPASSAAPTA